MCSRFAPYLLRDVAVSRSPKVQASDSDDDATSRTKSHDALVSAVSRDLERQAHEPLAPGLYLVATPIGNLGDVTLRALTVLLRADLVYCEDTRHSAKLLQHFSIRAVTRPFHDYNEEGELSRVLVALNAGKRVALISDAGTPLISDPGFKLVRACREAGHDVFSIPGASSLLCALSASGLPTDAFFFAGFLPPKTAARRSRLADIKDFPATAIFFEAPQRVADSLADMADVLGARDGVVARELTKLHEDYVRGQLPELAKDMAEREIKGEVVIVVGPAAAAIVTDGEIAEKLSVALNNMTMKDAAKTVAEALKVSKARVYNLGLKLREDEA